MIDMQEAKGWGLFIETGKRHVIPLNDIMEHLEDLPCWCQPKTTDDDIIVHNSMDEREEAEADYRADHNSAPPGSLVKS